MSEFTDATITADEFSEEVLKYPRNIGVDGALTSEWKNQNILGDFEVSFIQFTPVTAANLTAVSAVILVNH